MKRLNNHHYFIVFFLFSVSISLAQNKVIDSLENQLKIHKKADTVRIKLLNTLAFRYYNKHDLTKAQTIAFEANTLSKQLNFKKGEAKSAYMFCKIHMKKSENDLATNDCLDALKLYKEVDNGYAVSTVYNILGNVSMQKSDPDQALEYFTKAFDVAKEIGHFKRQSEMLINIGNISYMKGDLDTAIQYYKNALPLNEEIGDVNTLRAITNNIAGIYVKQGRTTEAFQYLNKNLALSKKEKNKEEIATATLNIGVLYFELEQYEKGIKYMKESLVIKRKLGDKGGIAHCLTGIGGAYAALNEYQNALTFFNEAIEINKAIGDKYGLVRCLRQIGGLNISMNELDEALNNYKKSLTTSESLGNKLEICNSHISLAEVYILQKKYNKALNHALKGEKLANELKLIQERKIVSDLLFQIYEVNGDYKKALNKHKQFKILNDSLFDKEKIEKITQLEAEYKFKKALDSANIRELKLNKTVKATSQDLEKSQRNNLLAVIGVLVVSILLGAIIFYQKLKNAKTKTQNAVIEQKLLRSQMTPHFIFNSLSVLQGMILNKEEKNSVTYLSKFSKLLRTILENSRHKTVAIADELSAIDSYMAIQNLDAKPPYNYSLNVAPNIDKSTIKIPPMLIQPFIENAVEHAFPDNKKDKKIDIDLVLKDDKLICTISDNGVGVRVKDAEVKKNKKSLATKITSERLEMLSKEFKKEGSITVKNRKLNGEEGTLVTLVIPYEL